MQKSIEFYTFVMNNLKFKKIIPFTTVSKLIKYIGTILTK